MKKHGDWRRDLCKAEDSHGESPIGWGWNVELSDWKELGVLPVDPEGPTSQMPAVLDLDMTCHLVRNNQAQRNATSYASTER